MPINGTYRTETVGWYQDQSITSACIALIAPTLIGLATIVIIAYTLIRTSSPAWRNAGRRSPITPDEQLAFDWFNPMNVLHMMGVSKAGGLDEVDFPKYDDDMQEWSGNVRVRLGKVGLTGAVGLVVR